MPFVQFQDTIGVRQGRNRAGEQLVSTESNGVRSSRLLPFLFVTTLFVSLSNLDGLIQLIVIVGFCIFAIFSSNAHSNSEALKYALCGIFMFCTVTICQAMFSTFSMSIQHSLGFILKLCAGYIVLISFSRVENVDTICIKSFIAFSVLFGLIDLFFELSAGISTDRMSALGYASKNYFVACLFFCMPLLLFYVFERNNKRIRLLSSVACLIIVVAVLISGSKTAALCLFSILIILLVSTLKDVRILLLLVFIVLGMSMLLSVLMAGNEAFSGIIERGVSIINGSGDDSSRGFLRDAAFSSFDSFSTTQKLFGIGNINLSDISPFITAQVFIPPHNLFAELLLSTGIIGFLSYVICYGSITFICLKKANRHARSYQFMVIICFFVTAWTQPFFSTSFTCGFLAISSILALSSKDLVPYKSVGSGAKK